MARRWLSADGSGCSASATSAASLGARPAGQRRLVPVRGDARGGGRGRGRRRRLGGRGRRARPTSWCWPPRSRRSKRSLDQVAEAVAGLDALADDHRRRQREGADRGPCRGGAARTPLPSCRATRWPAPSGPAGPAPTAPCSPAPPGPSSVDEPAALDRWLDGGPAPVRPRCRGRAGRQRRARPHPRPHEPPALRPGRAASPAALDRPGRSPLSGGSLAALTRVVSTADGARFGGELAAANHEAVAAEIDRLVDDLVDARDELRGSDPARVARARSCPMPAVELGPAGAARAGPDRRRAASTSAGGAAASSRWTATTADGPGAASR